MGIEQTSLLAKVASNGFLTADDRRQLLAVIENLNTNITEAQAHSEELAVKLSDRDAVITALENEAKNRKLLLHNQKEMLQHNQQTESNSQSDEVQQLKEHLQKQRHAIKERDQAIDERDSMLRRMEQMLDQLHEQMGEQTGLLEEKEHQLLKYQASLRQNDTVIREQARQLEKRQPQPATDTLLQSKQAVTEQNHEVVQALQDTIDEKEQHIQTLQHAQQRKDAALQQKDEQIQRQNELRQQQEALHLEQLSQLKENEKPVANLTINQQMEQQHKQFAQFEENVNESTQQLRTELKQQLDQLNSQLEEQNQQAQAQLERSFDDIVKQQQASGETHHENLEKTLVKMKKDAKQQHGDLQRQIKLISRLVEVATTEQNDSFREKLGQLTAQMEDAARRANDEEKQHALLSENIEKIAHRLELQDDTEKAENQQQVEILEHLHLIDKKLQHSSETDSTKQYDALLHHQKAIQEQLNKVIAADADQHKSVLRQLAKLHTQTQPQQASMTQDSEQLMRAEQIIQIKERMIVQLNEQLAVKNKSLLRKDEALEKLRAHIERKQG